MKKLILYIPIPLIGVVICWAKFCEFDLEVWEELCMAIYHAAIFVGFVALFITYLQ